MQQPDPARIAAALKLFFAEDETFEVRVLGAGGNHRWKKSTYCQGRYIDLLAPKIAAEAVEAVAGVHFTPNPVSPALARRSLCAFSSVRKDRKLTADEDVPARRWVLIDVDPVRADGFAGDSATDAEKAEAWRVLCAVRAFLDAEGPAWRPAAVIDSGNGYHAYYRLADPLPGGSADSATDDLAALLRTLAHRFDTAGAKIDTNVFNAARTMKVPGTPSRKGPNAPDRPHRTSRVESGEGTAAP